MGLSFCYSGSLKKEAFLDNLIDEVKGIAEILGWDYDILDTGIPAIELADGRVDGNLYGICFSPEKCEPVFLTFLSNRRLCSPVSLADFEMPVCDVDETAYLIWTKTQFAGPEAHISVIKLLRHISQKYLEEFTLKDEGKYWETGNETVLHEQFRNYNFLQASFGAALENAKLEPGETMEDIIRRIALEISQKRGHDTTRG